jgi:hypothetical protein
MPGLRRKGEDSTVATLQALIDFILSLYTGCPAVISPPTSSALADAIDRFLRRQLSFPDLVQRGFSLTGSIQPLERLRTIVETPPDPLPEASGLSGKTRRASRSWSPYEDQRLLAGIYHHGIENWTAISKYVGNGRTRSQCSQRWYRGLNPKIRKDQWSVDEENRLLALVREHGEKSWTAIASLLGNRSDVQCRYRYHQLQKAKPELQTVNDYGPPPVVPPLAYGPLFLRPPFPSVELPPIHVPLLPERLQDDLGIPVQFQIPPVRTTALSPLPPPLLAFPLPALSPPITIGQSLRFFPPPGPSPGESHEGVEATTFRGEHHISAPAFDGRLYSVY